jgi:hypothetical protein
VRTGYKIFGLALLISTRLAAQPAAQWEVRGDTSGAPAGCSAAAGIVAINTWFAAMARQDSAGFERAMAPRFVFSTGRFTARDPFFVARSVAQLVDYARGRARHNEQLQPQAITFNRWRGRGLQFGPVYFQRSAHDLGPTPRFGIGKGSYLCNEGLAVLNLAPRPAGDDGRSAMRPPR